MKPNFDPEVEANAEDESEVSSKVSIQEACNDSCCDNLINISNITNPIGIHPNSEAISLDSTLNSMNSEPGERDSIGFSFSSNEPASQTTAPTIPRVFPCNFCQHKLVLNKLFHELLDFNPKEINRAFGVSTSEDMDESGTRPKKPSSSISSSLDLKTEESESPGLPLYFLFLSGLTKKLQEEVDEFSNTYYLDLHVGDMKQEIAFATS
ncbi:hypothetical protein D0Y65_024242 [Glycine soja]|uniref:Uncharacterized protein n=1 Tax=Glycine soja TaxID=3848 RepID=A0A445J194_GLYSO|nr:hypothetical protein D0Y65_024242 [Glycine soja]